MKTPLIVLNLLFSLFSCTTFARTCLERQGALDIGSGSTKAVAAIIDVCQPRVVEVLFEESRPVSFNDALEKSSTGEIPSALIEEASEKMKALIQAMKEKKVEKITAIATSAFRVAKNGEGAARSLSERIHVPVRIVTQDQEAEIGYLSALSQSGAPTQSKSPVIVWDIGGGSMQMRAKLKDKVHVFKGDLASVTFKNRVIAEIQSKDPKKTSSPNPIGNDSDRAVDLAFKHAQSKVPLYFRQNGSKAHWIGIGGVLSISTQSQVNQVMKKDFKGFSRDDLAKTLKTRAVLKDDEIPSDYRTTDITNLALVLGYMKALGIEKLDTAESSLIKGWFLYQLQSPVSGAKPGSATSRAL